MFRTTIALAAAATVCGLAHAEEPNIVTAKLVYDPAKLTSEEGVTDTLVSLRRQARRACRSVSLVSAGFSYDEVCAKSLLDGAVSQIGNETLVQTYAALDLAESDS